MEIELRLHALCFWFRTLHPHPSRARSHPCCIFCSTPELDPSPLREKCTSPPECACSLSDTFRWTRRAPLRQGWCGRAWPLDGCSAGGPPPPFLLHPKLFNFHSLLISLYSPVFALQRRVSARWLGGSAPTAARGAHAAGGRWVPCGSGLYSPGRWLWQQQQARRSCPPQLLHPLRAGIPFFLYCRCREQKIIIKIEKGKTSGEVWRFELFLKIQIWAGGWDLSQGRWNKKSDRLSFSLAGSGREMIPSVWLCAPQGCWAQIKGCQGLDCEYFNRASKSTRVSSHGRDRRASTNLRPGDGPRSAPVTATDCRWTGASAQTFSTVSGAWKVVILSLSTYSQHVAYVLWHKDNTIYQ